MAAARKHREITDAIAGISPFIRFVAVIGPSGEVLSYYRREGLKALLDTKSTRHQFSNIAIRNELESHFDKSLGKVKFAWEERTRVQTISFTIGRLTAWISIDRKVVRSEVLRIIDSCLPIVKAHS